MNSTSKKFVDPCNQKHDDDPKNSRKFERESDVILKAGTILNQPTITATQTGATFNLASVTLDTSHLFNSIIKLDFAADLVATAFIGTINFQIVKQCDSQFGENSSKIWTFSVTSGPVTATTPFTFFDFDGGNCCGECCTYTVVATVVALAGATGTVTVKTASFGLLAVENTNKSRCCC
jgi:hypothetical protein